MLSIMQYVLQVLCQWCLDGAMDGFVERKLRESLRHHGVDGAVDVSGFVSGQVRLGAVIDQLCCPEAVEFIEICGNRLNVQTCVWHGDQDVRLTEKEVSLLRILFAADGNVVARDVLLRDVWEYADGVETHTLETHIYRLRQKIERDPSVPEILKTAESGYYLSCC